MSIDSANAPHAASLRDYVLNQYRGLKRGYNGVYHHQWNFMHMARYIKEPDKASKMML